MQEIKEKLISFEGKKLKISKRQLKIMLLAVLLILVVVFFVGELVVRIFAPQVLYNEHNPVHPNYTKEVEYDQDLGWSLVKSYKAHPYTKQGRNDVVTITHNSKGYRMDHEVDESKPIIVLTGDSLTYGFWVDDKKIVSAKLNDMLKEKYEVINLGVGGYGTDQSFLRFMRDGTQYRPKAVVHLLFTNDFSNIMSIYQYNVYKPLFRIDNNKLALTNIPVPVSPDMNLSYPTRREHAFKGIERFMRSWSHLYVLYKNKMPEIQSYFRKPKKVDYFTDYKDGELWSIEKDYTDTMKYAFALNAYIIKAYRELVKQSNATFILVLIGDRISVDPEMQNATVNKYYNINSSFFDYDKPYVMLEEFAKSENIKIINTLPLFREEFNKKKKSMYLEGDHHLNDYGHELVAKEIYKMLVEEGVSDVK